eukprot:CAMPEP_0201881966 /NCGR_PEP_ID=MMETSP0902-20130614/12714_1 /ASSEMBLY_ACC=CAM_ASM_000551 /TAXON_ID=420261 /ORGANISM="Thalassiosira antarctica, Strain CCMP982" /LENGTH=104 /DNA_ID=CAMNT_0048410297 /DNA_START=41 /DNA_END=355 /DNA_ORIENTATION=-
MFSSALVKSIIAAILLVAQASAFIPITNGPTLDAKKGKIAGIGGMDGPKPPTLGGVGAVKIKTAASVAPKKKGTTMKANKPANKKKVDTKKEKVDFFIKMPWSK